MKTKFPPGHAEAIRLGCKCPQSDAGAYVDEQGNPVYWFNYECPLHGQSEPVAPETILFEISSNKK